MIFTHYQKALRNVSCKMEPKIENDVRNHYNTRGYFPYTPVFLKTTFVALSYRQAQRQTHAYLLLGFS
jgi:hypothetical protein